MTEIVVPVWHAVTPEQACERLDLEPIFDTVSLTSSQWGIRLLGPIVSVPSPSSGS